MPCALSAFTRAAGIPRSRNDFLTVSPGAASMRLASAKLGEIYESSAPKSSATLRPRVFENECGSLLRPVAVRRSRGGLLKSRAGLSKERAGLSKDFFSNVFFSNGFLSKDFFSYVRFSGVRSVRGERSVRGVDSARAGRAARSLRSLTNFAARLFGLPPFSNTRSEAL